MLAIWISIDLDFQESWTSFDLDVGRGGSLPSGTMYGEVKCVGSGEILIGAASLKADSDAYFYRGHTSSLTVVVDI